MGFSVLVLLFICSFYNSLPPVSKSFGTLCVLTTLGYQLGVIKAEWLLLDFALVASKFQIWRLLTNFIFLGPFSMQFGVRILMIAKYGVQLEKGPFDKRTADFVWMFIVSMVALLAMALALPTIRFYVGHALVFMLLYVWSREFANARVSLMGLVTLQGFWLPWALLAVNTMFGHPFLVDLLGIVVGHIYYFLTVLHPQATGHNYLKTPRWVHQLVAQWPRPQVPSTQTTVSPGARTAFSGRSYRLNQ